MRELSFRSELGLDELESILHGEEDVPLLAIVLLSRAFGIPPSALIDGPS